MSEPVDADVVVEYQLANLARELARLARKYPGGGRLLLDLTTMTGDIWRSGPIPPPGALVLSLEVPAKPFDESPGDLIVRCRNEVDAEYRRMQRRMFAQRLAEIG